MDFLYDISEKVTRNVKIEPGRVLVIFAMLAWFAVGAAIAVFANLIHVLPKDLALSALVNLGAFCSIVFGFAGSVYWILKNK